MMRVIASTHPRLFVAVRVVCYLCALYFFAMGLALVLAPGFITRVAGPQPPVILGMLRGAGGSIVPYALLYVAIARSPQAHRWAIRVVAVANVMAISLDMLSVHLGEYQLSHAMFDLPVEALSLLVMLLLLRRGEDGRAEDERAGRHGE
jgi:hypothetical protein